ncbi:alpha/beta fold hydrolase [Nocardioides sp. NPDC051685]|uniref:alpha/beta fold hydrolase n=1 Tax=Nocardioides sp. NPDC051685 TaxID=3364334 RepID=UPI0037A47FCA
MAHRSTPRRAGRSRLPGDLDALKRKIDGRRVDGTAVGPSASGCATHLAFPSTIPTPGTTTDVLGPAGPGDLRRGRLRHLTGGTGSPLVLLHTVRTRPTTSASLIPLVRDRYTVYALDLPGMGHSEIVPGASYDEPAMRAAVTSLLTQLDLYDVTILGESMGAVLALTAAAELPDRVRRVIAINPYDYAGGIARSSLLARFIVAGVLAPGVGAGMRGGRDAWGPGCVGAGMRGVQDAWGPGCVGPRIAAVEPRPIMCAVLRGGLGDRSALRDDYLDELLRVGRRPGYPAVARAVYGNLPSLIEARSRHTEVTAPIHLVYGNKDWSRPTDRRANKELLPAAEFTEIAGAGHFIALERPDVPADLLNSLT